MQGPKPLFRALPSCQPLFSVALGQHRRSCSTVIHFSPHSFTLLCLLSVLACRHDQTGPRLFFFLSSRPVASRPRKHHELFIREVHWEEHLRIPVNVLDFPRSLASLRPFTLSARVARTKIRISWLLAMSGEKKPGGSRHCAFFVSPA